MTADVVLTIDVEFGDRADAVPDGLDRMIDVLVDYDAPAAFFVEGRWARVYGSALGRGARRAPTGTIFGLHGESHVPFDRLTEGGVAEEIEGCLAALAPFVDPAPLLRLPYGRGWTEPAVRRVTNRLGIRVVGWDVGTFDWDDGTSFEAAVASAEPAWGSGGVILLHQWPRRSPRLLAAILEGARAGGARISPLVPESLRHELPTGLVPRPERRRDSLAAANDKYVT